MTKKAIPMSRRTLLTALPASGAAAVYPLSALADAPTPIIGLFRQWERANKDAQGASQEERDRAVDLMTALESRMLALPSQSVADLAAKIAVYSSWGDFELPGREHMLWREMEALIAAA